MCITNFITRSCLGSSSIQCLKSIINYEKKKWREEDIFFLIKHDSVYRIHTEQRLLMRCVKFCNEISHLCKSSPQQSSALYSEPSCEPNISVFFSIQQYFWYYKLDIYHMIKFLHSCTYLKFNAWIPLSVSCTGHCASFTAWMNLLFFLIFSWVLED